MPDRPINTFTVLFIDSCLSFDNFLRWARLGVCVPNLRVVQAQVQVQQVRRWLVCKVRPAFWVGLYSSPFPTLFSSSSSKQKEKREKKVQ